MSSDAELDAKLTALLRVMVSRLPSNKTLPTPVAQQLLRGKYGDTYPEAYIASRVDFIAETIARLTAQKETSTAATITTAAAAPAATAKPAQDSSDDDDDSDEDSDDDSDEDSDEEGSASGDEEDEEDDDDDETSSEEDSDEASRDEDDIGDAVGPEKKKQRTEGEAYDSAAAPATGSVAERCKAMAECLRKLSYRVRAPAETESLDAYLHNFLIAEFTKHGMDPEKYSKSDIKRYRIRREVELLQQDGATLNLDRRNRAGRGFAHVTIAKDSSGGAPETNGTPPAAPTRQASMFLDDE